jgi:hypothetical protein
LTALPFRPGDFVWCAFPEREYPARPSEHRHIVYALAVMESVSAYRSIVAYTTSRAWRGEAQRPGVVPFSADQAAAVGQARPFWLHLWRIAHLPVTPAWFPDLSAPGGIVVGSATLTLRRELEATAVNVAWRRRRTPRPARPTAQPLTATGPPERTAPKFFRICRDLRFFQLSVAIFWAELGGCVTLSRRPIETSLGFA